MNEKDTLKETPIIFDFKRAQKFFLKWGFLLLLLIPIFLSAYIRIQTWDLHAAERWAANGVNNMLRNNIRAQVDALYPNLPDQNKQAIVEERFQEAVKKGTVNIQGQEISLQQIIDDNAKVLREHFQDPDGRTYLLGLDEYFWQRLASNVVKNGFEGTIEKDGRYYDGLILAGAPLEEKFIGTKKVTNLHTWIAAHSFKIVNKFDPKVNLMEVNFFIPAFAAILAVIPAFFIGRRIAGDISGLVAGTIVAVHQSFLSRSIAGSPDTDVYVIAFSLMAAWLFLEACEAKKWHVKILLNAGAALSIGLFAYAWTGWFFIIEILAAAIGLQFIYYLILNRKTLLTHIKDVGLQSKLYSDAYNLFAFVSLSAAAVSVFISFEGFMRFISDTIGFTKLKEVASATVWPNVLTTVAELNPSDVTSTISQISYGSPLLLWLAFTGIAAITMAKGLRWKEYWLLLAAATYYAVLVGIRNSFESVFALSFFVAIPVIVIIAFSIYKSEALDIKYAAFVLIWFIVGLYAATKGVRFVMLLVPAFALALGGAMGIVYSLLVRLFHKELSLNKSVSVIAAAGFALIILIFPVNFAQNAYAITTNQVPIINDVWFEALEKIKAESEPDAIINSWWDFGHWFAAIGDRAVTLDGGRQNRPQAHWLGKLMLTGSEDESVGILRMLDCGATSAFDKLYGYMDNDSLKAIGLLYDIIPMERDDAKAALIRAGLTSVQAEDILSSSHCEPPENYFITSEDMIGKSGVWAHFGAWNLTRASMYMDVTKKPKEQAIAILKNKYGLNDTLAATYFNEISTQDANTWVSPWPSYAGGLEGCQVSGSIVQCANGIVFNRDTEDVYIKTQIGDRRLKQVGFIDKNREFKVKSYDKDLLESTQRRAFGAILIENPANPQQYSTILMDADLVPSIFTRLFFFDGHGLHHFKKFYHGRDLTGANIIVWKIDWEGSNVREVYMKPATPSSEYSFAECLADSGAIMYGASWCSHCQNQKRMLNNSRYIPYVECDDEALKQVCEAANVTAYPTWIINGSQYLGEQSLESLSILTGCPLE